ncbi:MAG TPA: RDD family protein [Opitutaceae bacterium]|nr:RDD family protein [Opitutaceae bacterium]
MSGEPTDVLRVRTPEGVSFVFRIASPVMRLAALVVDWAVVLAAWSALAVFVRMFAVLGEDIMGLVGILVYFALSQGYRIAAEWKWRGQTLGKRLLRLRVVDEQGRRLRFEQIVMRNLLRFVDALPGAYMVGGAVALLNRRGQRLGDLTAGTLVIWEPAEPMPDFELLRGEKYNSLRGNLPVVARLRQSVPPEAARTAWQALVRRDELEAGARVRLFGELAAYFRSMTRVPDELVDGVSDEQFVRNVVDVLYVSRG